MERFSVAEVCLRARGLGTGGDSASWRPGGKTISAMKTISMGFPMLDLEKISQATVHRSGVETWDGSKKFGRTRDRLEKKFPDEKVLLGRYALGLGKKSTRGTLHRSENIGAGK